MTKQLCKIRCGVCHNRSKFPPGDEARVSYFKKLLIGRLQAYYDGDEDEVERLTR